METNKTTRDEDIESGMMLRTIADHGTADGNSDAVLGTSAVSRQLSFLIVWIFGGIVISMLLYKGTFLVFQYPLSDLGAFMTETGGFNVLPRIVFDLTMTVAGLLMLGIFSAFSAEKHLRHGLAKRAMAIVCALGFFIVLMPYDINLGVHEVGASLVFGILWGLTVLFSVELKQIGKWKLSLASEVVLQATVLPYAFMFVAGIPAEVAAQKIAVVGLMTAIWLATR